jgi:hypothetical protein
VVGRKIGLERVNVQAVNVFGTVTFHGHTKGNKTIPGKVAATHTEDGHKQTTKTSTTI